MLTASLYRTVWLWDVESGECLCTMKGHEGQVWSDLFSPDGAQALTASDNCTARPWDAESGECFRTLQA